jgi:hypothetical protein
MAETDIKNAGQLGDELKNALRLPSVEEFQYAFERISSVAREVNNLFGQSRERIVELKTSIADSLPGIVRLGGQLENVGKTIEDIALASKRNIVANSEVIEKLYASFKVTGLSIREIADGFLDVGVGLEQMGEQLEDSVNYVRSIGGNTQQVMRSVQSNMDQMNRYQFEGGVQGLTKMAAQASMLRFDMTNTFAMAEKVLTPEGAIEMASAFQRLGVSAGALADPFALMNQSINDPSGLQTSLAEVSKQFTYFDEKTKTFKINPQGVLTLREMEREAGVAQGSLSKMGLAAAELDARLSDINSAGLSIASEEDKQYLANISTMKDGKYMVTLEDDTQKELAELTQPEFDKLIEEQKKGPKSMEEIAKSQMTITEDIAGNVNAIRAAFVGGMVTQKDLSKEIESVRDASSALTGAVSRNFSDPKAVRDFMKESFGDIEKLFKDISGNEKDATTALSDYFKNLSDQGLKIEQGFKEGMIKSLKETRANIGNKTEVDKVANEFLDKLIGGVETKKVTGVKDGNRPISSLIEGNRTSQVKEIAAQGGVFGGSNSKVNFDGKIELVYPPNSDFTASQKESINKSFTEWAKNWANSTNFQQYVVNVSKPNNPIKGNSVNVFGP